MGVGGRRGRGVLDACIRVIRNGEKECLCWKRSKKVGGGKGEKNLNELSETYAERDKDV